MQKKIFLYGVLGFLSLFLLTSSVQAAPNRYEREIIERQIVSSFRLMVQQWQEELYFEIYDLGQKNSKQKMSIEEFAQRMVDLKWRPSLAEESEDENEKPCVGGTIGEAWNQEQLLLEKENSDPTSDVSGDETQEEFLEEGEEKAKECEKTVTIKKITIFYRNFASVQVQFEYEDKVLADKKLIKEKIFPMFLEKGEWKFDLMQLIQTPY